MSAITIRLATSYDLDALCRLYVEFHEFHVLGVSDRLLSLGAPDQFDCGELNANLTKIIEQDDAALLVAESDGQVVGLAEIYLRHDDPKEPVVARTYGYLQSVAVHEPVRRHGVGRQLLQAAEQWAKSKGAVEIRLDTWEFEAGPLRFYEKSGYHTLSRTLLRRL
jgi:GNAT superfamily N-acetyltransferase